MRSIVAVLALVFAALAAQPSPARGVEGAQTEALRREVASRGWIVFAGHPLEIDKGKLIANPDERGQADLYLCRPDGSQLRNLTNTPEFTEYGAMFSRDGKKLLYRRVPSQTKINHDQWGTFGELVIANVDGSNPVAQGQEGEYPWASWGPDRTQIACLHKRENVIRIYDLATKKIVKEMPAQGVFQQLLWSPDGKRLVGTANVAGRQWNIVTIALESQKLTLLSRALNCTPDWFQADPARVIYSNRTPGITPRLGEELNNYGFTVLMQAAADGKKRTLVYGALRKHVYFGCLSPDDKYVLFADDPQDSLVVGEMRVLRLSDSPIIAPEPEFPELKERYPAAKDGPVLDLKLPGGTPLRGFEPHWTYAEIGAR